MRKKSKLGQLSLQTKNGLEALSRPEAQRNWKNLEKLKKMGWIIQPKHDGDHMAYMTEEFSTSPLLSSGLTRNGEKFYNAQFPELMPYLEQIPHGTIVEGEIIVETESGQEITTLATCRVNNKRNANLHLENPSKYILFDVLFYKGKDVRAEPYTERHLILEEIIDEMAVNDRIQCVQNLDTTFTQDECSEKGLEGYIARNPNATFYQNPTKFKADRETDFIIVGIDRTKHVPQLMIKADGIESKVGYYDRYGISLDDIVIGKTIAVVRYLPVYTTSNNRASGTVIKNKTITNGSLQGLHMNVQEIRV